jgi:hypothetical protein
MQYCRWLLACLCALSAGAHAQLRTIPGEARPGEIRQATVFSSDGVAQHLAPGAQIRDASNRVLVPAAVPDGARVKYLLDVKGAVRQVWILTAEEAAKK